MLKRTLTGSVILFITIAFILLKQVSSLFFDAFILTIMYFSIYEIISAYKIAKKQAYNYLLYVLPAIICLIYNLKVNITDKLIFNIALVALLLIVSITIDIIKFAIDRKKGTTEKNETVLNESLFNKTKTTLIIYAYPILPLSFMFAINSLPYQIGYMGLILIFAVAMLTDTVAYLLGRAFGKRKFVPEVSPKKTIAGMIGGFIGGTIGAIGCFFIFYYTNVFNALNYIGFTKSFIAFMIVGVIGSYINQIGDLIASALKRKVNLKDYGHIFPGHGGFMDRFDGNMFVSVLIYVTFVLLLV